MKLRRAAFVALVAVAFATGAATRGAEPEPSPAASPPPAGDAFLAEASPLLSDAERAIYLALERPYQRAAFARRFWQLRDPYPETPVNELLERWRERLPQARERFGTLDDARARVLLLLGEPAQALRFACAELLRDGEVWVYRAAERVPEPFALVFVAGSGAPPGGLRLWSPGEGLDSLAFGAILPRGDGDLFGRLAAGCARGPELAAALGVARDFDALDRRWSVLPHPSAEWANEFRSLSPAAGGAGAAPLDATLELAFPALRQSRTVVDATLWLAPAATTPVAAAYALDGDVVRGEELFESFRYRFDPPASARAADGRLPLRFERALRPGYRTHGRTHGWAHGRGRFHRSCSQSQSSGRWRARSSSTAR